MNEGPGEKSHLEEDIDELMSPPTGEDEAEETDEDNEEKESE